MESVTSAKPTKNFFVNLFIRDIDIEGAIFDLVDNSIDGANRNIQSNKTKEKYAGKWIDLTINECEFSIIDNCGGIPEKLIKYAFRFGRSSDRPEETSKTVGIYGIGMKRSMYRIGTSGLVISRNSSREFEVDFSEHWTKDDDNWELPVSTHKKHSLAELGTHFKVENLREDVRTQFADPDFVERIQKSIALYYAYIIKSGLRMKINGELVKPIDVETHIDESKKSILKPHVFELIGDAVSAFGVVGIRPGKIVGDEDGINSRELSGITVICNDRVVLFCNKDWRTGWGEPPVPNFHNQFIGVSGVVTFSGRADALPMGTDKRTIDLNSDIFAAAKVSLKKGIRRFTEMTNKWKGQEKELRSLVSSLPTVDFNEVRKMAKKQTTISLRRDSNLEKLFKGEARESAGKYPEPKPSSPRQVRISFSVEPDDYEIVSVGLFGNEETDPSSVGLKCFQNELLRSPL